LAGSTIENVGFDKTVTPKAANDLNEKAINLVPELKILSLVINGLVYDLV
jgi:hypothetical protein